MKEPFLISNKKHQLEIDYRKIKKAHFCVKALDQTIRKNILLLLAKERKLTVSQIQQHLKINQAIISQHLTHLRKAGFVENQRDGKHIHYQINKFIISNFVLFIEKY